MAVCGLEVPVTIVVLTWNGISFTKACLDSIHRVTSLSDIEVVVVDNGSDDGTVEYLKSLDWIHLLSNGRNLGFVQGNNTALRLIDRNRDVILLNNDTEVHDPLWVWKMQHSAYRDEKIGIVGCRIRRKGSDMLQHAGTHVPDFTYWGQQIGSGEKDINQYNTDHDVEGVVFACVYLKRALMERIGFLDKDYFSYFEDTDYCLKAKTAGFRVVNCGTVTIEHREHGATAVNKVNHNAMFLKSQKIFLKKWKAFLDSRLDMGVVWHSTFTRPVGYAMTSRQLALGLESVGVGVAYEYLYGPGTVFPVVEKTDEFAQDYKLNIIRQRKPDKETPHLIYGQGDALDAVDAPYRIGYTMLETTGIPSEWVRQCNRMDELWVPSPFNAWSFRKSGVRRPIRVMPLGLIDTHYFNPEIKGYPIEGQYTFLSIFEWGERKAPEILLRAFNKAFKKEEPVLLVCKYSNSDPEISPDQIIDSLQLDPNGGRIFFSENENVPYYQLPQLYCSADCFVLPTRGEGWGMPILEAMACGLPVVASYWSAQQYFMNDTNSYPLQVSLIDAVAKCPYYNGFKWAEPSESHLARLLRHVYTHQEEAAQKGRQAAGDVLKKWSLHVTAMRMRQRLEAIQCERTAQAGPQKKAAEVGEVMPLRIAIDISRGVSGQITGVGRYATTLVKGLKRLPLKENPYDYLLLPGFDRFIHPEYARSLHYSPEPDPRMTLYRGPLPAFSDPDHHVSGVDLVYCTSNCRPETVDVPSAMVVYDTTFITHPQFHTAENIALCDSNFRKAIDTDCRFIAISNSTQRDFITCYGVDSDRVSVAYCGVDRAQFYPRSQLEIVSVKQKFSLPDRFFLYVGSLEPRKNLRSVIHAMNRFKGKEQLVVVGASGWLNSDLNELIQKSRNKVISLGYVHQNDLPKLYSGAVATVYPSFYEGFGYPVVESMACGTPVITSNNSSLAEIGSEAALMIEHPDDPAEISDCLSQMVDDQPLYDSLVAAGIERAALYTPERCAQSTLSVFNKLLSSSGEQ